MDYATALAWFAAANRLIDHDDYEAIVRSRNGEMILSRAQVVTAASAMKLETLVPYQETVAEGNNGAPPASATTPEDEERPLIEYCAGCFGCLCHGCQCDKPIPYVPWQVTARHGEAHPEVEQPMSEELGPWPSIPDVLPATVPANEPVDDGSSTSAVTESTLISEEDDMNRHVCEVTGRNSFAGQDGRCKHCRPTILAGEEVSQSELAELMEPEFVNLLDQIGGQPALEASIEQIQAAKLAGRAGTVPGRLTRELLDLIMLSPQNRQGEMIAEYRALLDQYGILLTEERLEEGVVYRHDYRGLVTTVQGELPGFEQVPWQARSQQYALRMREARIARRAKLDLVMEWTENGVKKQTTLGPNNEETRKRAGEYQVAARLKGRENGVNYRVRFYTVAVPA